VSDWIHLTKPAGLPTLTPNADPDGDSLLRRFLADHPEQVEPPWPIGYPGGILHRLDTQTSGLVIAATSLDAFARGRAAFESHTLRKTYRFLTQRDVAWGEHVVTHDISHDKRKKSRMVWLRGQNTPHRGKWHPARTELRRLGTRGDLHLWQAVITTGVMHQIRVHAAAVGLPLHGDRIYGGGPGDRFFLHHARIDGWPEATPDLALPADWPA
jgi:23S rRNA pseudouridine1911/1915/1917 synthase